MPPPEKPGMGMGRPSPEQINAFFSKCKFTFIQSSNLRLKTQDEEGNLQTPVTKKPKMASACWGKTSCEAIKEKLGEFITQELLTLAHAPLILEATYQHYDQLWTRKLSDEEIIAIARLGVNNIKNFTSNFNALWAKEYKKEQICEILSNPHGNLVIRDLLTLHDKLILEPFCFPTEELKLFISEVNFPCAKLTCISSFFLDLKIKHQFSPTEILCISKGEKLYDLFPYYLKLETIPLNKSFLAKLFVSRGLSSVKTAIKWSAYLKTMSAEQALPLFAPPLRDVEGRLEQQFSIKKEALARHAHMLFSDRKKHVPLETITLGNTLD